MERLFIGVGCVFKTIISDLTFSAKAERMALQSPKKTNEASRPEQNAQNDAGAGKSGEGKHVIRKEWLRDP